MNAFLQAFFVLVEVPEDRFRLGRTQPEAFAIASAIRLSEQILPVLDFFPVHPSPVGSVFIGGIQIDAVELIRIDINPALIGCHFEPRKAFFHQISIHVA
jgi:hypothetical protein